MLPLHSKLLEIIQVIFYKIMLCLYMYDKMVIFPCLGQIVSSIANFGKIMKNPPKKKRFGSFENVYRMISLKRNNNNIMYVFAGSQITHCLA